jgi:hypothetical protein
MIEIDPDEHVASAIRLVFAKLRELGSARQVFLWLRSAEIKMPILLRNVDVRKLVWKALPITASCRCFTIRCTPARMAALLDPPVVAVGKHVCAGEVLHADDTTVKVLAPGLGRTKPGLARPANLLERELRLRDRQRISALRAGEIV